MVDTREYVSTLRTLVEEGNDVSMTISGSSMAPFLIHGRDSIIFGQPERELRRGDIVFFQRRDGSYVLHRIRRVDSGKYYIIGDAQTETEGPVDREQIFAVVKMVRRKGKIITPRDFWWKFFAGFWLDIIPLRRLIVRIYALRD